MNGVSAVKLADTKAASDDTASVIDQQIGAAKAKSSGVIANLSTLSKIISAFKVPRTNNMVSDANST